MPQSIEIPLGWPLPKRKKFLADLAKNPQGKYGYPLKFQSKTSTFPVYAVRIDLPKYRLANGRTQAAQEEYLAKHPKLGTDFFERDPELDDAQSVQHKLLGEMVDKTDLWKYFEDTANSQEQPLILTYEGFVVNGNRRLCAMRAFYYGDQEKYKEFSHVDVVILQHCDSKDLDELEAYLQIQPDIKEEYTWIAMACMLRARQITYHYTNDQLAALYSISENEIKSRLAELALVDEYLESRGKPKQYDVVEEYGKYAFRQIHKGRLQLKEPHKKDIFTGVAYDFIDDRDAAEGRLYERIPEIKDTLPDIITRLSEELKETDSVKSQHDYSAFGTADAENNFEPLVRAVAQPKNRAVVIEHVMDIIDAQKEKKKNHKKANAVLKQITDANTRLASAVNYITENTSAREIG